MEGITLNESALQALTDSKRPVFIYEWLTKLDGVLSSLADSSGTDVDSTQRMESMTKVRQCQKELVGQLVALIQQHQVGPLSSQPQQQAGSPGSPLRMLIAKCLTNLFTVGDTFLLFDTINKCNDLLKNRDDSQGFLVTRLTAIRVLGTMYERLGRMTGRSYEETVTVLNKGIKNAESQTRSETMIAFGKVCTGLGSAASSIHRDIYKSAKSALTDRAMPVRAAAAECLLSLAHYASFMYTTELDTVCQASFRALDGANHEARRQISKLLGTLIAFTQKPPDTIFPSTGRPSMLIQASKKGGTSGSQPIGGIQQTLPLNDAMSLLIQGYIKGGSSGSGLMISKSGSIVSSEVRVGVSQSIIVFAQSLGGKCLERNLRTFVGFLLTELLSHPKTTSTHTDAVFARRCVGHIIRALVGRLLSEKAQLSACKDLSTIITTLMIGVEVVPASTSTSGEPTTATGTDLQNQHVLVVALQELGHLLLRLGTSVARSLLNSGDATTNQSQVADNNASTIMAGIPRLTDTLLSVLLHPCPAPRLAAAWCLRCLSVAVPSHLTPAIDLCLDGLENLRRSPEAIYGYSAALASLLGAVRHTPLGIPHTRGKIVFNVGEELLRSASQNSRLSRERTQAGWLLISSIMTLGSAVVKGLLPRMMLLWRNAFPRSPKELDSEKSRGDGFTWKISLEARAGALSSMHSFLKNSPDLVTEDIIRRLGVPLESALILLSQAPNILKNYLADLKPLLAMVRLRLFETLSLLPPNCLDGSYAQLLRLLVSEFTLVDGQAGYSTSLITSLCHSEDAVLLVGPHLSKSSTPSSGTLSNALVSSDEMNYLEEMLIPNSLAGCGALEHDLARLYSQLPEGQPDPGAQPLGIAVIDISIVVFGVVFPRVAQKHRLQMLEHFGQHLRIPSVSSQQNSTTPTVLTRPEAISTNILAAILSALRGLVESKSKLGQDDIKKAAVNLVLGCLTSSNAIIRCSAAECLGRMAQVVSDPQFVAEMAQNSFDSLKSARDVVSRTGHSLALGCLHRYVGGMGSSQHLHTSVSILLALAQDTASPQVQVWALHALAMIADSGGPMFRSFVEPTLSTVLKLLLTLQGTSLEVMVCLGRLLSALITTVGPELQGNSAGISSARSSFLSACSILNSDPRPVVQAEAISGLQQVHMFAPSSVNLRELVPKLCRLLNSPHFVLRKSCVACIRQFSQREAATVFWAATTDDIPQGVIQLNKQFGLPGMLFSLMDYEVDPCVLSDIHDTITSIMHSMVADKLTSWLHLCREMLSMSSDDSAGSSGLRGVKSVKADDDEDGGNDDEEFTVGGDSEEMISIQPRWPTRVFAASCLRKIIEDCCQGNRAHYDKGLAQEMHLLQSKADFLVLHLSELVRVAFMAATSDSDPLRLEGLKTLEVIIEKFGETPEPEFPGHVILEQYQAQVGAALRPAFAPDTPSHVTAAACNVCSAWMGSGVARELSDLRRVYQLLVSSLGKLKSKVVCSNHTNMPRQDQIIYNESALTLEKLSILKAWAEVYIASMKNETIIRSEQNSGDQKASEKIENYEEDDFGDFESTSDTNRNDLSSKSNSGDVGGGGSLASLVQAELPSLSKHWLAALKDHALLSLPPEFKSQLPFEGGAFYSNDTVESARQHYRATWPPILHATSIWLTYGRGFENVQFEEKEDMEVDSSNLGIGPANAAASKLPDDINTDRFHLVFGVSMEALSNTRSADMSKDQVTSCVLTMRSLLDNAWVRSTIFSRDKILLIELCNVLHRTVLTRDHPSTQIVAVEVLHLILSATLENLESLQKAKRRELGIPANRDLNQISNELPLLGEGGESGSIEPGKSVAFATLEVCLCILVRYYPDLSPRATNLSSVAAIRAKSRSGLNQRSDGHGKFGPNEQQACLIASTVRALSRLPGLCSPMGALTVLPSIMWLVTGVLKESTGRGSMSVGGAFIDGSDTAPQVAASLQSLKTLVTSPHARDDRSKAQWSEILQSSLLNILDLAKTSQGDPNELHDVNLLKAVAVFILHGPEGTFVRNAGVRYPAINAFVRTFQQSGDPVVRRTCIQTAASIFEQADHVTAISFVQALAPIILEFLLVDESSRCIKTESDMLLTLECVRSVEILMTSPNLRVLSEGQNEEQADENRVEKLLIFFVPVLVSHLLRPEDTKEASHVVQLLHEKSLARLTTIGQRWPQHFKAILSQQEELKTRLETALIANQERLKIREARQRQAAETGAKVTQQVPSIKLTMDFASKFAAK